MDRRGRAGQVVDLVDFDVEGEGDIVTKDLEVGVRDEVEHVLFGSGVEIVHADHVVAFGEQAFAKVGAQEARPACD
jgi:hypothetical protein